MAQHSPISMGEFNSSAIDVSKNNPLLRDLEGPHKYSAKLLEMEAKEDGMGEEWKWRLKKWPLVGLAYYDEVQGQPSKAVQGSPDDVHVLMPRGPMPENVAYIWPDRALVYVVENCFLPASDQKNLDMPHREITKFRNHGFMVKAIAATVPDPPKTEHDREAIDSLGGRFSERDQNYRVVLGVFSPVRRKPGSAKAQEVYNTLGWKSVAELFHGVTGTIDPFRFKWSPPFDPMHNKPESNTFVEYDLPPPEDIPAFDRKFINERRIKRGLKKLPSFAKFLLDARLTFEHYFYKTHTMLFGPKSKEFFKSAEDVLKTIENERVSNWATIKSWPDWKTQFAVGRLAKNKQKHKRNLERARAASVKKLGDTEARPAKKARGEGKAQTKGSPGSNVGNTPRTPNQCQRRQSGDEGMQALAMSFTPSPSQQKNRCLSQLGSSPLTNISDQDQGSPYAMSDYVLEQFLSSPAEPYRSPQDTREYINGPTSGPYSRNIGNAGQFARPGAGYGYPSMKALPPPPYNPSGFNQNGVMGDLFDQTRMGTNQQHVSSQMPAPRMSMGNDVPSHFNDANLRSGPQGGFAHPANGNHPFHTAADLDLIAANGSYGQGMPTQVQPSYHLGLYAQGAQAPSYSNGFAPRGGGYAPNYGANQQSTQTHQTGGSNNVMIQTQNNYSVQNQNQMGGNTTPLLPSPFPNEDDTDENGFPNAWFERLQHDEA